MLLCYALAALLPGPGVAVRRWHLPAPGAGGELTVSAVLLAAMLFNAGLGVRPADLRGVVRRPGRVVAGVLGNALLPLLLLPVLALLLRPWGDPAETEALLVGLLLVLAMPIAGGAAAWGQNAGGNVPLVVTMVLGSTLLSPLTVPLGLRLAGGLVGPDGAGGLDDTARIDHLAGTAVGTFALVSVVAPCLAGIGLRRALGERRTLPLRAVVRPVNLVVVLALCYLNASGALGRVLRSPDPDLLALTFVSAGAVCAATFLAGAGLSWLARCDTEDAIAMTFATGMNNSSAAAVLAAARFADRPEVLLPILAYSLLQKSAAAVVGTAFRGGRPRGALRPASRPSG